MTPGPALFWPRPFPRAVHNEALYLRMRPTEDLIDYENMLNLVVMELDQLNKPHDESTVGFSQVHGLDFTETFASTVKFTTMRFIFYLVAYFNLQCEQTDVDCAFIYADLKGDIDMDQPAGFEQRSPNDSPRLVCLLKKAIYDSQACIAIATTYCTSNRTKHLNIRLHFVCDAHKDGIIRIYYEPIPSMLADIFTKPVNNPQFETCPMW
eukprot:jgi/Tetstr1/425492/TSEL_015938.t1